MKLPKLLRRFTYRTLAVGFACVALALTLAAQEKKQSTTAQGQSQTQVQVERGEVVYVSGNDLVVKMSDGEVRHVVVPDSARITVEGKELSIHDLKPGMKLERTITTTTTPELVTTIRTVEGKILMVQPPKTVTLQFADGSTKTYNVPKDQKFMINGQEKTVWDLKKGMEVSATAVTQATKDVVEQTRKVTGAMPPPPPTPPTVGVILFEEAPPPKAAAPPAQVAKAEPAKKLPQTASPLPLIGLLGTLLLAAGFGLRAVRLHAR